MQEVNEEGIWPLSYRPEPCDDPKWELAIQDFLRRLDTVQKDALKHRLKEFVRCRICGQPAEAANLRLDNWVWPAGLRHYVQVHNFKPSHEFIELIVTKTETVPLTKQEKEAYKMTTRTTNKNEERKSTKKTASRKTSHPSAAPKKATARKASKKVVARPEAKKAYTKKATAVNPNVALHNSIAMAGFAGFFRVKEEQVSPLPWPVVDKLVGWTKPVQSRFVARLERLEDAANKTKQRGVFKNVLDGSKLENVIYEKDGFRWTSAIRDMVSRQAIQVPDKFAMFVLDQTLELMPMNASEKKFYNGK
jgi:hypothetical protein